MALDVMIIFTKGSQRKKTKLYFFKFVFQRNCAPTKIVSYVTVYEDSVKNVIFEQTFDSYRFFRIDKMISFLNYLEVYFLDKKFSTSLPYPNLKKY